MSIYTSRYNNPELRNGRYTAVRISLGTPKWNLGYSIDGEIPDLMPAGMFGNFDHDPDGFKLAYFKRLNSAGVRKIHNALKWFEQKGKDVILCCFEDIRKPEETCHRRLFAEWWLYNTGEIIDELPDPTTPPQQQISFL
jgi:hypothetical protein